MMENHVENKDSKQRSRTILLVLALVAVVLAAYFGYQWLSKGESPSNITAVDPTPTGTQSPSNTENPAPDFTVVDAHGNDVKLSESFGTPIVLNFWASWCGPCQLEMSEFQSAYQSEGSNVVFFMVNLTDGSRETLQTATDFIDENKYTFPVYFDTAMSAVDIYAVRTIPVTYFIDAQGQIVAVARGSLDAQTLQEGIGMITQ